MVGKRAFLSALLVAVIACGGSTPTTSGASASAGATTASTAPSAAASAAVSPAASGARLSDLLASSRTAQYKVTYKISGSGAQGFSTEQTWYFKPPRSRFDFGMSQGGQTLTISFFSLPDGTFYCFNAGQAQCLKVSGVSSPLDQNPLAVANRSLIENPSAFGATFSSSRNIAGQTASCYDVTSGAASAGFSTGSFCYTSDGVPLLSQFSASGATWSMEATNYSATVPDSDFTLPARP